MPAFLHILEAILQSFSFPTGASLNQEIEGSLGVSDFGQRLVSSANIWS